jgi:hypothetical protein
MPHPTRPFLALYVVWHTDFAAGAGFAENSMRTSLEVPG